MERLTIRDDTGQAYPIRDCDNCQEYIPGEQCSHECLADLVEVLAAYEDSEEQGLLLRLPCKQGTKVFLARKCLAPSCEKCRGYTRVDNCIAQYKGRIFEQEFDFRRHLVPFGKTVFFTYDEAYCALCKQSGLTADCKDTKAGYICERYKGKAEKALKEQENSNE